VLTLTTLSFSNFSERNANELLARAQKEEEDEMLEDDFPEIELSELLEDMNLTEGNSTN
jgi:hypothetical protein